MAQQQLLLILLGIIVISLAIATGFILFADHASTANRDALAIELNDLAARMQQYYRRPQVAGGGGNSFDGLTIAHLTNRSHSINGTYIITGVSSTEVKIHAAGRERSQDGSPISITMMVFPDSSSLAFNN